MLVGVLYASNTANRESVTSSAIVYTHSTMYEPIEKLSSKVAQRYP